jgi:hypothetical protein
VIGWGRSGVVDANTLAANAVLIGTEATRPIEPTSARTISTATTSRVATDVRPCSASLKSSSNGSEAPAYARKSVLTVEEMWSRPIRRALPYSSPNPASGAVRFSSHTADTCVTVTSSSTPSEPITTPASSNPRGSTCVPRASRNPTLSSPNPVNFDAVRKIQARMPVSARLANVDSSAAAVARPAPCARKSATKAIAPAATSATATEFDPSSSAGRANTTSTTRLIARPASAPTPRQRPNTTIAATNRMINSSIGVPRWKS